MFRVRFLCGKSSIALIVCWLCAGPAEAHRQATRQARRARAPDCTPTAGDMCRAGQPRADDHGHPRTFARGRECRAVAMASQLSYRLILRGASGPQNLAPRSFRGLTPCQGAILPARPASARRCRSGERCNRVVRCGGPVARCGSARWPQKPTSGEAAPDPGGTPRGRVEGPGGGERWRKRLLQHDGIGPRGRTPSPGTSTRRAARHAMGCLVITHPLRTHCHAGRARSRILHQACRVSVLDVPSPSRPPITGDGHAADPLQGA